mgnify:CR=1 FL=1
MDLHEIAELVAGNPARLRLRQAEVVSVAADGSLTVTIAGSTTEVSGVKALASVCPLVGSGVWLATDGMDVIAIGTVTPVGPAYCSVRRPTDQSIADATDTAVNFTSSATVEADTHGMFDTGDPDQLTVQVPGVYLIEGYVYWPIDADGTRLLWLEVDGGIVAATRVPVTSTWYYQQVSATVEAAAAATIELMVRQNAGNALNLTAVNNAPRLAATWLRPVTS